MFPICVLFCASQDPKAIISEAADRSPHSDAEAQGGSLAVASWDQEPLERSISGCHQHQQA